MVSDFLEIKQNSKDELTLKALQHIHKYHPCTAEQLCELQESELANFFIYL